jgi:phosphatidylinositol dimannoside acyltransferase
LRERVTHGISGLAEVFTDIIRRNPQDWHMLQKVWPDV